MPRHDYTGLLIIGDPHLSGRTPGFRKDDYSEVTLNKFAWALQYAEEHRLLPVMLGDLFDRPRDNPTALLCKLIDLLKGVECVGIYGNHDCSDPELKEHDSLSLLVKADCLRLLDEAPWKGVMNGRTVFVGGSSYRKQIPQQFDCGIETKPLVFWISHHDLIVPGYEENGHIPPREIPGINLVINGHIHRALEDVQRGTTLWITPGNISRRSRSDATQSHVPAVLRIDITEGAVGYTRTVVEVPHRAFDEVFHPAIAEADAENEASAFVAGLAQLQAYRTEGGVALIEFLELNLVSYEDDVADEIRKLAQEVTNDRAADTDD